MPELVLLRMPLIVSKTISVSEMAINMKIKGCDWSLSQLNMRSGTVHPGQEIILLQGLHRETSIKIG